jgi:hypothetical protein
MQSTRKRGPRPERAVEETGSFIPPSALVIGCRLRANLEEATQMTFYQMYFKDETDRIALGEDMECADDSAALRNARAALRHRDYPVVEVWDHEKRVGRAKRFDWIAPASRLPEHRI